MTPIDNRDAYRPHDLRYKTSLEELSHIERLLGQCVRRWSRRVQLETWTFYDIGLVGTMGRRYGY